MLSGFAGKTVAAHSKVNQSRTEIREGREASSGHGCSIRVMIPVAREVFRYWMEQGHCVWSVLGEERGGQ